MDYEEFLEAIGNENYHLLQELYQHGQPIGHALNRVLMRDFRIYMAVGGMPQAVAAYAEGKSFAEIDFLTMHGEKVRAIEVKSSGTDMHESLTEFKHKYRRSVEQLYVISQKDLADKNGISYYPIYMAPFLI